MAQTYNKMKIDIKEPVTDIITAKQNDSNSRFLDVYLYDGGVPIDLTGHEVRIYMLKPDGTEIFNNGEITNAAAGRCQFELTSQALGAVGVLKCEISIWQGNTEILTTQTFHVFVAESLRSNGSIESSNEYGALVVLFQNLYQSIDLMQDMVANFGTPSGTVDADTFWQMLEKLYEVNEAALANASVSEVLNRIGQSTSGETLFQVVEGVENTSQSILSKLNAGSAPAFRSPTKVTSIKASSDEEKTFSGTGKGILLLSGDSASTSIGKANVTIDGVSFTISFTSEYITIPLEFSKSFNVKIYGSYAKYATAVFYA